MTQLQYYTSILNGIMMLVLLVGGTVASIGFVAMLYYFTPWFLPPKR